jgi:hypothetical protein
LFTALLYIKDEAGGRAQAGQGLRPGVFLLVELLPSAAAGEVSVAPSSASAVAMSMRASLRDNGDPGPWAKAGLPAI